MPLPSCSASSRQRGRRRELILDLGLVIIVVVLACTRQEDMHPAKYVFGIDGAFFFLPSTPFRFHQFHSTPFILLNSLRLPSPHFAFLCLPFNLLSTFLNSSSTSIQLLSTYLLNAFNSLSTISRRRFRRASSPKPVV